MDVTLSQDTSVILFFPTLHKRHISELIRYVLKHHKYRLSNDDLKESGEMLYWEKPQDMDIDTALHLAVKLSDPGIKRIARNILKVYVLIESQETYVLTDDFFQGHHCLRGYCQNGHEIVYQDDRFMMNENQNILEYQKLREKCQKE